MNAIAPSGDLTKIGRAQFALLFRVADTSRRGLVSWDDFTVFETLLKRPDADYWMAFRYFDVYVQTEAMFKRVFFDLHAATTTDTSHSTNSKTYLLPMSGPTLYLSTLTGE